MKGYSLTEGMRVKLRYFYEQNSCGVNCRVTGDVTFDNSRALNGTIRHMAIK